MQSAGPANTSNSARYRVSKRTSNACVRCRRQKIKCSGTQPCEGCSKRQLACVFDDRDQKIIVTRGYLNDLQNAVSGIQKRESSQQLEGGGSPSSTTTHELPTSDGAHVEGGGGGGGAAGGPIRSYATPRSQDPEAPHAVMRRAKKENSQQQIENESSSIDNPLRHSEFTMSSSGRAYYLGTSSNWSFTRRILLLTHEHVCSVPLPTQTLLFDGAVYNVDWENLRTAPLDRETSPVLPTFDHTIYLINSVKFHFGQLYHLFDEDEFMESCRRFFSDPTSPGVCPGSLWYLHFCLIIALGKAHMAKPELGKLPFGHEFFLSVVRDMPNMGVLINNPLIAIEILCCMSVYLQCIDHRHYAEILIGEALRIALDQGFHTNMPIEQMGAAYVERCRRVWWTVYVLDRESTSLMGHPTSIHDDDINCQLPNFGGSSQRVATLDMQVKLCRIIASINKRLYRTGGNIHCKYLERAKETLENIANVAEELRTNFPLQPNDKLSGISRTSAHLHLLHHSRITLVTRPLLFYLLKLRFTSPDDYFSSLESMQTVRNFVQMCIDSSQQMIAILECLLNQGLLATFIPHDLEAVFVSTTNLLLGPAIDAQYSHSSPAWLHKAFAIFDEMIGNGNLVADFRKTELQQLQEMLGALTNDSSHQAAFSGYSGSSQPEQLMGAPERLAASAAPDLRISPSIEALTATSNVELGVHSAPTSIAGFDPLALGPNGDDFDAALTREQILGIADAIDDEDMAWMYDTIMEHSV